MKKEIFCKYLEIIEKHYEKTSKFSDAINIAFDGLVVYTLDDEVTNALIETVELLMGDKEKWTSYFIYDLDFGKRTDLEVTLNDEKVDLYSPEKLYDFIVNI